MRALLMFLSTREGFKRFFLRRRIFRETAWRFVAGETLEDGIRAVRRANAQAMPATLDLLGENVESLEDARRAAAELTAMLRAIREERIDCTISVKLTQLGLGLDPEFCCENLRGIVRSAAELGNFVTVDMEDGRYTAATLAIVGRVRAELDNIGAVTQAYLYRSAGDVARLLASRTRVRLCKGAYLEPETIAFRRKADTDRNFVALMRQLLSSGLHHAIATHDEKMIEATRRFAAERGLSRSAFEYQMLYGVRRDLQRRLAGAGYTLRVYIPYGRQWYPYFMRRLAERPANVGFILRNLFRG